MVDVKVKREQRMPLSGVISARKRAVIEPADPSLDPGRTVNQTNPSLSAFFVPRLMLPHARPQCLHKTIYFEQAAQARRKPFFPRTAPDPPAAPASPPSVLQPRRINPYFIFRQSVLRMRLV